MEKTKILVVEDEAIIAKNLQRQLVNYGYVVPYVEATGEGAVSRVSEEGFDLVLMDIVLMGEMDGIEAGGQIRSRFDVPVIYLTAYADETILERAKITEPFGYIVKPFEDRELHSSIQMALYKHEMEKKLRESRKWLTAVLNSIGDAVIATDTNGTVLFINPVAEKLTGWKEHDSTGKSLREIFNVISEDTRRPAEDLVGKVLKDGVTTGLANHTLLVSKDGDEIPIDDSRAPIIDEKGNITGVVLAFHDITERRKTEEEIMKSKVEWELTFDNANELIVLIDKELRITRCNRSFSEFVKKPFHDIIGRPYTDFIPYGPEELKKRDTLSRTEIKTEAGQWLYLSFYHIKNQKDEFLHTIIIATNITELKMAQQNLMGSREELKSRVKDLEDFYEMAIGRELKMKELKARIAELDSMLSKERAGKQ